MIPSGTSKTCLIPAYFLSRSFPLRLSDFPSNNRIVYAFIKGGTSRGLLMLFRAVFEPVQWRRHGHTLFIVGTGPLPSPWMASSCQYNQTTAYVSYRISVFQHQFDLCYEDVEGGVGFLGDIRQRPIRPPTDEPSAGLNILPQMMQT